MIAQTRADERQRLADERAGRSSSRAQNPYARRSDGQPEDEGYWAWTQRQLAERTEKLGIMGDSMDRLENNSSGFADDVKDFVSKQKRGLVMGGKFSLLSCYPLLPLLCSALPSHPVVILCKSTDAASFRGCLAPFLIPKPYDCPFPGISFKDPVWLIFSIQL